MASIKDLHDRVASLRSRFDQLKESL